MKAYKGFNADMTCRGFQYKEGETYHEDIADLCHKGFHACEYPLDVLAYYPPNSSVYHEVELEEVSEQREEDSKVCAKTIRVGARIDIASLVKASIEYTASKCDGSRSKHTTGYYSVASATGRQGAASATGYYSVASATGDQGVASATGDRGVASATGRQGAASATSDWSVASATGDWGVASATGDWGAASATGYRGAASATGCKGAASADNPTAIAVAWGLKCRAKGVLGAHIVCAEWEDDKLIGAKMARVDGDKIKADTYYMLKNGEFTEVNV